MPHIDSLGIIKSIRAGGIQAGELPWFVILGEPHDSAQLRLSLQELGGSLFLAKSDGVTAICEQVATLSLSLHGSKATQTVLNEVVPTEQRKNNEKPYFF